MCCLTRFDYPTSRSPSATHRPFRLRIWRIRAGRRDWPIAGTWTLLGIGTFWAAYGESRATSATTSDLTTALLASLFEQDFELKEHYLFLGASINLQITPRLPLIVSYDYINVTNSKFTRNPGTPPSGLPGFLSSANPAAEDTNHTLNVRLSYWLSPRLNLSLTGNLYSNQFLGVVPHYNNPLSGSFSSFAFADAMAGIGKAVVVTDRSTGIITLEGGTRLRPDYFVTAPSVADLIVFNAGTDAFGIVIRIRDVDLDGIDDYRIINASGTQLLYGLP